MHNFELLKEVTFSTYIHKLEIVINDPIYICIMEGILRTSMLKKKIVIDYMENLDAVFVTDWHGEGLHCSH